MSRESRVQSPEPEKQRASTWARMLRGLLGSRLSTLNSRLWRPRDRAGVIRFAPSRRCCDCDACRYFTDEFTRADGAPGDNYLAVSGTWQISGNELINSASGMLLATVPHPSFEPDTRVELTVTIPAGAARVLLDYVDDDNYWYAELAVGDTDAGGLRIVQVASGAATTKASVLPTGGVAADTPTDFCASIDSGVIAASCSQLGMSATAAGSFSSYVWGLAAVYAGSPINFDSLAASRTNTAVCRGCNFPCGYCSEGTYPKQIKVVLPAGQFAHYNPDGLSGCAEAECPLAEGTYYLPRVTCLEYNDIGYHMHAGACPGPDREHEYVGMTGCPFAACTPVPCASEGGYGVLSAIYCLIGETRVLLCLDVKQTTQNGILCDAHSPSYQAWYEHEFGAAWPVPCTWTDVPMTAIQIWDGDHVYTSPGAAPSGTFQRCLPDWSISPVITAIP